MQEQALGHQARAVMDDVARQPAHAGSPRGLQRYTPTLMGLALPALGAGLLAGLLYGDVPSKPVEPLDLAERVTLLRLAEAKRLEIGQSEVTQTASITGDRPISVAANGH